VEVNAPAKTFALGSKEWTKKDTDRSRYRNAKSYFLLFERFQKVVDYFSSVRHAITCRLTLLTA